GMIASEDAMKTAIPLEWNTYSNARATGTKTSRSSSQFLRSHAMGTSVFVSGIWPLSVRAERKQLAFVYQFRTNSAGCARSFNTSEVAGTEIFTAGARSITRR